MEHAKLWLRRNGSRMLSAGLIVLILFGLFGVLRGMTSGQRFFEQYERLQIGMSEQQVNALFSGRTRYECKFANGRILYFSRDSFADARPKSIPAGAKTKDEIPFVYGSAQVYLDHNNLVRAYSWNGEALNVVTSAGKFKGSAIQDLDDKILEQVSGSAD